MYRGAIDTVATVSTPEAAELTKLLENIFRSVNIALVNELAQLCDRMDIDVWEVVGAAATKPFGFMSFQPGPGPRRALHPARPVLPLVEGARVRLHDALHRPRRRGQQQHAVLLPLGDLAGDEPRAAALALRLARARARRRVQGGHRRHARDAGGEAVKLLRNAGADVAYHDPHVPEFDGMTSRAARARGRTTASRSSPPTRRSTTATSSGASQVVVDFRNATAGHESEGKVWKL